MKRLIAFISILLLASVVSGTATSITIYGTNRSNANSNITCYGCNNSIYVNAWNTSYVKNITVNSSNASGDVVSFNISNVTGYQVQELKVNGTSKNVYQAGANGMLNFSYTVVGNKTLVLSPAIKADGRNFTWGWFDTILTGGSVGIGAADAGAKFGVTSTNDIAHFNTDASNYLYIANDGTTGFRIGAVDTTKTIAFQTSGGNTRLLIKANGDVDVVAGTITGNGSGLSSLNASNITIGTYIKTVTVNRSYVKSTVYQNTNSTAMFITTTALASGSGTSGCNYKTGTTNPPTDLVGSQAEANADMQSFWVLPQHYFAAFESAGTCTIVRWSVWQ